MGFTWNLDTLVFHTFSREVTSYDTWLCDCAFYHQINWHPSMYCGHSFAAMSLFLPSLVTMHHILWQYVIYCHIISLSVTSGDCNFVITWQSSCCRPFRTAVRPSPSFAAQSFVWKNKILMKNGRKSLYLDRNLWLGKSSQLQAKWICFLNW